jgi:hypothetical protein
VVCDPLIFSLPVHAPEATHEVTSLLLQARVAALPGLTVLGVAWTVTVGDAGCVKATCADSDAEPPAPLQVSV